MCAENDPKSQKAENATTLTPDPEFHSNRLNLKIRKKIGNELLKKYSTIYYGLRFEKLCTAPPKLHQWMNRERLSEFPDRCSKLFL